MKNIQKTIFKIPIVIIIIIVSIFLLLVTMFLVKKENFKDKTKNYDNYHVVCARYNKNVDFLDSIPISKSVITKGGDVPNKANEATTYLYYIIHNYDKLPENIIFIHDENESWHHTGKITDKIYEWINEYESAANGYYEFNNPTNERDMHLYNTNSAFKEFWDENLKEYAGEYEKAEPKMGKCCSQFIISKNVILKKPKNFYQKLYDWILSKTSSEGNGDPKDIYSGHNTGRYAEFTWRYMFS